MGKLKEETLMKNKKIPTRYVLYVYGRVWVPRDNPIHLEEGYYWGYELNDYVQTLSADDIKSWEAFKSNG